MNLSGSVLVLFVVAMLVALVARRFRVPYTVALVAAGLALGSGGVVAPPPLTRELLFALFLPGLLFEAALHLDADEMWRNRVALFSLSLPGVVVAVVAVAAALLPALRATGVATALDWRGALLFATLIAATDPIAVVALFRTLGAPRRLALLVEGESLLNDGTAVVFYTLALTLAGGSAPNAAQLATSLVYQIGGGVVLGGALGVIGAAAITRLGDPMLEITLTTVLAYGAFAAGEHAGASGVIATVTAGILCGVRLSRNALAPSARLAVEAFWEYVAFALNSIVFLLIGFRVSFTALVDAWRPILVAFVVVSVVRALVTYALAAVLPKRERLPRRWIGVLAWSGLRGALSMVLALSLPAGLPARDELVTMTFGVVVLSIVLQGLTISPLLRALGIVRETASRADYEETRGELAAARAGRQELERMTRAQAIPPHVAEALAREYDARVARAETQVRTLYGAMEDELPEAEIRRTRRRLAGVERDRVLEVFRVGAMREEVRDRLLADLDARLISLETAGPEETVPPTGELPAAAPEPADVADRG